MKTILKILPPNNRCIEWKKNLLSHIDQFPYFDDECAG